MNNQEIIKNLDCHLVLARFSNQLSEDEKLQLILKTKNFNLIKQMLNKLNSIYAQKILQKCNESSQKYDQILDKKRKQCQQFLDLMGKHKEQLQKESYSIQIINQLELNKKINQSLLINVLNLTILLMDQGNYEQSLELLEQSQQLFMIQDQISVINKVDFLIGKINLLLILKKNADIDINSLFSLIIQMQASHLQMVQYKNGFIYQLKITLLNLTLINAFNSDNKILNFESLSRLVNIFIDENFIGLVQKECQYLQKYLLTSLIYFQLKPLQFNLLGYLDLYNQNVFDQENILLKFCQVLFEDFDYKESNNVLFKLEEELKDDILLKQRGKELKTQGQKILLQVYCEINSSLDINMTANILELSIEEAELWMVNFIRNLQINAKIDSENQIIKINKKMPKIMEQIYLKIEPIIERSNILVKNITQIQQKLLNQ